MKIDTAAEKNAGVQQAYPKGRWTVASNPFSTVRRVPAASSQGGVAQGGTVQGELSLEKVRPVRNDLSDTDLELIPRKQAQENVFAAPAEPGAAPVAKKPSLWARLTARMRRKTGR